ncbi:TPA: hypothetical protein ACHGD4_005390, partial [Escherichia coli]
GVFCAQKSQPLGEAGKLVEQKCCYANFVTGDILQYSKYTIFRKLIVPYAIFKILLLIAVAPSFLCTFRITHRIPDTKNPRIGGFGCVAM